MKMTLPWPKAPSQQSIFQYKGLLYRYQFHWWILQNEEFYQFFPTWWWSLVDYFSKNIIQKRVQKVYSPCCTWRFSRNDSVSVFSLISSAMLVSERKKIVQKMAHWIHSSPINSQGKSLTVNPETLFHMLKKSAWVLYLRVAREYFAACMWGSLCTNCFISLTVLAPLCS